MDKILIEDITTYGFVGFYPAERELGQWFCANVTLFTNLNPATQSDRLADTINYQQIIEQVQARIKTSRSHLIEHLAAEILTDLFKISNIESITIKLTKINPPIADFSGKVTVELTRDKLDTVLDC